MHLEGRVQEGFLGIIEIALINGFVLYNLCRKRSQLADSLTEDFVNKNADADSPTTSPGRKSKHNDRRRKHFATLMKKKGRCAACGNKMITLKKLLF